MRLAGAFVFERAPGDFKALEGFLATAILTFFFAAGFLLFAIAGLAFAFAGIGLILTGGN